MGEVTNKKCKGRCGVAGCGLRGFLIWEQNQQENAEFRLEGLLVELVELVGIYSPRATRNAHPRNEKLLI